MSPAAMGVKRATQRKAGFWQSIRTVAWGVFGVRGSEKHRKDASQLSPSHVIIAGLLLGVLFVVLLVLLVNWVHTSGFGT